MKINGANTYIHQSDVLSQNTLSAPAKIPDSLTKVRLSEKKYATGHIPIEAPSLYQENEATSTAHPATLPDNLNTADKILKYVKTIHSPQIAAYLGEKFYFLSKHFSLDAESFASHCPLLNGDKLKTASTHRPQNWSYLLEYFKEDHPWLHPELGTWGIEKQLKIAIATLIIQCI